MTREHIVDERGLTRSVIGAFFDVYNALGFGFLEHIYVLALERELRSRGHDVAREVAVRVFYRGEELAEQRMDMIVDHELLVEIKSTYELRKEATRQVYNYLRATNLEVGLLLHFGPKPKPYRIIHPRNKKFIHMIKSNPTHPADLPSREPDIPFRSLNLSCR